MKYTVIKSEKQYREYCQKLEALVARKEQDKATREEIELLTVLIEKWDADNNTMPSLDPVQMIKALMEEHNMKANDLAKVLGVSKSLVSSVLHYRRGLSKDNIRKLAEYFKLSQEAFNRSYELDPESEKAETAS